MRIVLMIAILMMQGGFYCNSQALKKIKVRNQDNVVEKYFVLKSDPAVKHGKYEKIAPNGQTLEKGFFRNNQKDSIWTYYSIVGKLLRVGSFKNNLKDGDWVIYSPSGGNLVAKGQCQEDQPIGEWLFFDESNRPKYVFDQSKNEVVKYYWRGKSNRYPIFENDVWTEDEIDIPPMPYNEKAFEMMIAENVRYPLEAMQKGIAGSVIVAVTIDNDGNMNDVRIKHGVHKLLDDEAVRVVKSLKIKWQTAKRGEEPITVEHLIPINFELR